MKFLPLFLLVFVAVLALQEEAEGAAATPVSSVWVVGDSLTNEGRQAIWNLRPGWEINAENGRPVDMLPWLIEQRLARGDVPRLVVLALGTNAVQGWGLDDYRAAVAMFPASTKVVLVTTYRDGQAYARDGLYSQLPRLQSYYSAWMRQIAAERPDTCVAEWRNVALSHPEYLRDGTHATTYGYKVRARKIVDAAVQCW